MCNLVRLHPQPVPHPLTGVMTQPRELIQEYFRPFAVSLFLHGGHPVITSRKVAGYIDSWNVPPDPGWTMAGMMRYRSRRDMLELTLDPRFMNAYPFKAAAVEQTYSFPTQVLSSMVLRPRSAVALGLMLLASLCTWFPYSQEAEVFWICSRRSFSCEIGKFVSLSSTTLRPINNIRIFKQYCLIRP